MVTLIIFWSAVFAVLLFLIGVACKAVLAVIEGGIKAATYALGLGILGIAAVIFLYLVIGAVNSFLSGTFWSAVGEIVLAFLLISLILGIVGGLGAALVELLVTIIELVFSVVSFILVFINDISDKGYVYFVKVIIRQIEKC